MNQRSDEIQQKPKFVMFFLSLPLCFEITISLYFVYHQGTQLGIATDFGHTTLANLNPNDDRVRYQH